MCRLSVRLRVASLIFSPLSTHPVQSAPHSSFYLSHPYFLQVSAQTHLRREACSATPHVPAPHLVLFIPLPIVCVTLGVLCLCLPVFSTETLAPWRRALSFAPCSLPQLLAHSSDSTSTYWRNRNFLRWFIHSGRLHLWVSENSLWSWWGIIHVFRVGSVRSWGGSVSEGVLRRKWLAVPFATGMKKQCQWLASE